MALVVTLADFRPSPRHDNQPWTQVRVEQAKDPEGSWSTVDTIDLEPVDTDPSSPALRSITAKDITDKWCRLVFIHESEEDAPCPFAAVDYVPFLPTLPMISAILRARTYSGAQVDPENPLAAVAGGVLQGEFGKGTRPTAEEVEDKLIPQAARDVILELGNVPGQFYEEARRITALRVASEIERSFIPEQAEGTQTIYQTLRMTYQEEVSKLATTIQWWVLANGQPASKSPPSWPWFGYVW